MGIAKCRICKGEYQKHNNWRRTLCTGCHYKHYIKPYLKEVKKEKEKPPQQTKAAIRYDKPFGQSDVWHRQPIRKTQ